ncbi:hypothetical protein [Rhodopseudomonas sp.]|uniref:hypothetical protein n=1 Tax=Rhodopseudomonas sp. TaxID=1078 RepID=UPI003B3B13F9
MFEIVILGIIALAAAYWAAMWLIGRHDDVLYGSFVTPAPGMPGSDAPFPDFPDTHSPQQAARPLPPELPRRPRAAPSAVLREEALAMPEWDAQGTSEPPPGAAAPQRSAPPARASAPQQADLLASLLETIKRDLGEGARR